MNGTPMTATRIVVVGVGRIGAVTAVGLAHLGQSVTGIDQAAARVTALAGGRLPEAEPGLAAALQAALRFRTLAFQTGAPAASFDLAFLCVDTPPLPTGEADLRHILAATEDAARWLTTGGVLVTRSTVPVGTGDRIAALLARTRRADIDVVHVPEFLREGHAWQDFREPDRIVVGGESPAAIARVRTLFAPLCRPIIATDRRTAELAKYAANAFLATSISFANEIADLSVTLGADAGAVFEILRADHRIGRHAYLTPGLGFGGHCLPKDTAALEHTTRLHGRVAPQLQATRPVNEGRPYAAVAWLRAALDGLDGRRLCLAGLAFKHGTDDLRASPSLHLARALALEGAQVSGWDPNVRTTIEHVSVCASLDEALDGADALIVAHAWPGWRDLDPASITARMRRSVVFDAPGVLDARRWSGAGFAINRPVPGRSEILVE